MSSESPSAAARAQGAENSARRNDRDDESSESQESNPDEPPAAIVFLDQMIIDPAMMEDIFAPQIIHHAHSHSHGRHGDDSDEDDDEDLFDDEDSDDDDAETVNNEHFTSEEWIASIKHTFLQKIRYLEHGSGGKPLMTMNSAVLAAIIVAPALEKRYFRAIARHDPPIHQIGFTWGDMERTAMHLARLEREDGATLDSAASKVGKQINGISSVSGLIFVGNDTTSISAVASLAAECRQHVTKIAFNFPSSERTDHITALKTSVMNHANLSALYFSNLRLDTFCLMGPLVPGLPQIFFLDLRSRPPGEEDGAAICPPLTIVTQEAATVFRNILEIQTLQALKLDNFIFKTRRVGEIIGAAWSRSQLKTLTVSNLEFLDGAEALLACALGQSSLEELEFTPSDDAKGHNLMALFAEGLKHASTIHTVTVGMEDVDNKFLGIDSESLVPFLKEGHHWKVRKLFLRVKDWTKAFDAALSDYVRNSGSLQEIFVIVPHDYSGPMSASEGFSTAVDSGKRCLEEFGVVKVMPWGCRILLWGNELEPILRLNRMRRMYGHLFERIAHAATVEERRLELVLALEAMGIDVLYEFHRRDEWGLRELVKQFALKNMIGDA